MPDSLPLQNTTPYNSEDNNKNKKFYILAGAFLVVILLLTGGIFYMDKLGIRYEKKSDTPTRSAASENPNITTEDYSKINQEIVAFAKQIMKPEYVPRTLNISQTILGDNTQVIKHIQKIDENSNMVLTYKKGQDGNSLFISVEILTEHLNGNLVSSSSNKLETAVGFFNKYMLMPRASVNDWKESSPKEFIYTYELVTDNPDGTFDTRSAYLVDNIDKIGDTGLIAACQIQPEDPLLNKSKTCFY